MRKTPRSVTTRSPISCKATSRETWVKYPESAQRPSRLVLVFVYLNGYYSTLLGSYFLSSIEWCIRQALHLHLSYHTINIIAHNHRTDIYPLQLFATLDPPIMTTFQLFGKFMEMKVCKKKDLWFWRGYCSVRRICVLPLLLSIPLQHLVLTESFSIAYHIAQASYSSSPLYLKSQHHLLQGQEIDSMTHCDSFYQWLCIHDTHHSSRAGMVHSIASHLNVKFDGLYDMSAYNE